MTGSSTPPSPLKEIREHLLPTDPSTLAPDLLAALRAFCEGTPGIAAGYLCAVEVECGGVEAETLLRFSVKLRTPVKEPGDAGPAVLQGLIRHQPSEVLDLGLGILADRAVPAWEKFGVRVFPHDRAKSGPEGGSST